MKPERRSYHRVKPQNVQADVFSMHPSQPEISLNGEILDISRTGIRIKLSKPLAKNVRVNDKLKITMVLPESGSTFSIHGTLTHLHSDTEFGVHYTHHAEGSVDDMLFECIKLNESMLLIKSI